MTKALWDDYIDCSRYKKRQMSVTITKFETCSPDCPAYYERHKLRRPVETIEEELEEVIKKLDTRRTLLKTHPNNVTFKLSIDDLQNRMEVLVKELEDLKKWNNGRKE